MRHLILICFLFFGNTLTAQVKYLTIIEQYKNNYYLNYKKKVDFNTKESSFSFFFIFQTNNQLSTSFETNGSLNTSKINSKSIAIFSKEELNQFFNDLKSCYKEMKSNQKVDISWERSNYRLSLYNFSKNLYVYVDDTDAKTILSQKDVIKILEIIARIDFGTEVLFDKKTINDIIQEN